MARATSDSDCARLPRQSRFIGHRATKAHRYELSLAPGQRPELSSQPTGATGRGASLKRGRADELPAPTSSSLAWFVREAYPPHTSIELPRDPLAESEELSLVVDPSPLSCLVMAWNPTASPSRGQRAGSPEQRAPSPLVDPAAQWRDVRGASLLDPTGIGGPIDMGNARV